MTVVEVGEGGNEAEGSRTGRRSSGEHLVVLLAELSLRTRREGSHSLPDTGCSSPAFLLAVKCLDFKAFGLTLEVEFIDCGKIIDPWHRDGYHFGPIFLADVTIAT